IDEISHFMKKEIIFECKFIKLKNYSLIIGVIILLPVIVGQPAMVKVVDIRLKKIFLLRLRA
ncbi:MAG: hypothetical protein WCB90_14145, partial [Methanosarcina sp.]